MESLLDAVYLWPRGCFECVVTGQSGTGAQPIFQGLPPDVDDCTELSLATRIHQHATTLSCLWYRFQIHLLDRLVRDFHDHRDGIAFRDQTFRWIGLDHTDLNIGDPVHVCHGRSSAQHQQTKLQLWHCKENQYHHKNRRHGLKPMSDQARGKHRINLQIHNSRCDIVLEDLPKLT